MQVEQELLQQLACVRHGRLTSASCSAAEAEALLQGAAAALERTRIPGGAIQGARLFTHPEVAKQGRAACALAQLLAQVIQRCSALWEARRGWEACLQVSECDGVWSACRLSWQGEGCSRAAHELLVYWIPPASAWCAGGARNAARRSSCKPGSGSAAACP